MYDYKVGEFFLCTMQHKLVKLVSLTGNSGMFQMSPTSGACYSLGLGTVTKTDSPANAAEWKSI